MHEWTWEQKAVNFIDFESTFNDDIQTIIDLKLAQLHAFIEIIIKILMKKKCVSYGLTMSKTIILHDRWLLCVYSIW